MLQKNSFREWLTENRDICVEVLRIYLGLAMILKGMQFIIDPAQAEEYMEMVKLPFFSFLSIHIVLLAHLAGGFLLTIGLVTRVAALIQIPNLLGAIFFVHLQQGLFSKTQNLEFVILVLVLLLFFAAYGGGRLSVDELLTRKNQA